MIVTLIALVSGVASFPCKSSAVAKVSRDNDPAEPFILATKTGDYRLAGQDFIHPREWARGDNLQICAQSGPGGWVKIVNTTRGETLFGQGARRRDSTASSNH
jgi:hypothetical protein